MCPPSVLTSHLQLSLYLSISWFQHYMPQMQSPHRCVIQYTHIGEVCILIERENVGYLGETKMTWINWLSECLQTAHCNAI